MKTMPTTREVSDAHPPVHLHQRVSVETHAGAREPIPWGGCDYVITSLFEPHGVRMVALPLADDSPVAVLTRDEFVAFIEEGVITPHYHDATPEWGY